MNEGAGAMLDQPPEVIMVGQPSKEEIKRAGAMVDRPINAGKEEASTLAKRFSPEIAPEKDSFRPEQTGLTEILRAELADLRKRQVGPNWSEVDRERFLYLCSLEQKSTGKQELSTREQDKLRESRTRQYDLGSKEPWTRTDERISRNLQERE